jgi:serine/threonine protein kinase
VSKVNMDKEDLELLRKEVEIMKMCQHKNIIKLFDVFESKDTMYIVMELLAGRDMFKWLDKRDFKLKEDRAREISHKIACAIYYMHSFGIAHRDLKPENILMTSEDDSAELKIVDFGLSKIIGP